MCIGFGFGVKERSRWKRIRDDFYEAIMNSEYHNDNLMI